MLAAQLAAQFLANFTLFAVQPAVQPARLTYFNLISLISFPPFTPALWCSWWGMRSLMPGLGDLGTAFQLQARSVKTAAFSVLEKAVRRI